MRFSSKALIFFCFLSLSVSAQIVRMETVLGNIDIELRPDVAPETVANFLNYVNDEDYDSSYIHRSVKNFIIQGGGYTVINGSSSEVATDAPIINESTLSLSNVRGTISMARTSDVNSATSQWFINVVNNSDLDGEGTGYAVFGSVIRGMDVVDAINALKIWNLGGVISAIPLINYSGSGSIVDDLVVINKVYVLDDSLHINSALSGAWFNPSTSGQGILIEVLPKLNSIFMAWFTYDTQTPAEGTINTIGSASNRWLTGFGSINHDNNSVTLDLTATSNGLFDNTQTVINTEANTYGTATINFADCSNATVSYELYEQQLTGTFPMVRIASDNVALCESLSQAAAK
jgi:peptidyl-prolyl cis-trans isomerase A (cyclophilin A)